MVIFRRDPLQPPPGVTKFRFQAGTENLNISGSARTYHSLRLPGEGGKVYFFSCTFMIYNYIYLDLMYFSV